MNNLKKEIDKKKIEELDKAMLALANQLLGVMPKVEIVGFYERVAAAFGLDYRQFYSITATRWVPEEIRKND